MYIVKMRHVYFKSFYDFITFVTSPFLDLLQVK